jgi:hypothetical protein
MPHHLKALIAHCLLVFLSVAMGDSLAENASQILLCLRHNFVAFLGLTCPVDIPLGPMCTQEPKFSLIIE